MVSGGPSFDLELLEVVEVFGRLLGVPFLDPPEFLKPRLEGETSLDTGAVTELKTLLLVLEVADPGVGLEFLICEKFCV